MPSAIEELALLLNERPEDLPWLDGYFAGASPPPPESLYLPIGLMIVVWQVLLTHKSELLSDIWHENIPIALGREMPRAHGDMLDLLDDKRAALNNRLVRLQCMKGQLVTGRPSDAAFAIADDVGRRREDVSMDVAGVRVPLTWQTFVLFHLLARNAGTSVDEPTLHAHLAKHEALYYGGQTRPRAGDLAKRLRRCLRDALATVMRKEAIDALIVAEGGGLRLNLSPREVILHRT